MHKQGMVDNNLWGERRGGRGYGWERGGAEGGRGPGGREPGAGRKGPHHGPWDDGGRKAGAEERGRRQGPGRNGRGGGGRDRARRGDARLIILDALRSGPKHGYEVIKTLEERSAGEYAPSPGTVYPTLQYLEDQGLVRAHEEAERRVYALTEAGLAELDAQAQHVAAFWQRTAGKGLPPATQHELDFLHEELEHLNRIVRSALRPAIAADQSDTIRRVRAAVEDCQNKVREIIATGQV